MQFVQKKLLRSKIFILLGLFSLYFVLLCAFRHRTIFGDEIDNFIGGISVVSGGDIYKGFISQHMPILYYVSAFFRLLGASSVIDFRVSFYILLSLIWVVMYFNYSEKFGRFTMAIYPIFYILMMEAVHGFYSTAILSEQFQAQGMVVLLLEFTMFYKTKEINMKNIVAISLAILFSFGTAFVSVFAILVIAAGVGLIEIREQIKGKHNFLVIVKNIFFKYWKLIFFVALPFVILFAWYLFSENLQNAYKGIITLNTDVYVKYNGGFGTSIISTVFGAVDGYFLNINSAFVNMVNDPLSSLRILFFVFINLMFVMRVFKKDRIAAICIIPFIFMCGIRGYTGFHSLPYWGVTVIMGTIIFEDLIVKFKEKKIEITFGKAIAASLILFMLITPYFAQFSYFKPTRQDFFPKIEEGTRAYYIDKITSENDKIQIFTLETYIYLDANRLPATIASEGGACPWAYEVYGKQILDGLKDSNPKVIVFNEENEVWGYIYKDFAPEIVAYVKENYSQFAESGISTLYVRNNYYEQAIMMLKND